MNPLASYQHSLFLCEPTRLQRLAARAAAVRPCPTPRELVESRQRWEAKAAAIADGAIVAGGIGDPIESIINSVGECVAKGESFTSDRLANMYIVGVRAEAPRAIRAVKGKIGIIPIHGPTDQRMTAELEKAGGTPLDFVSMAFDSLMANPAIGAVVLHVDTPGGTTSAVEELSDKIFRARDIKPTYTMVDSLMASAGLWYGTATSMVVITPSGEAGSHGVYALHYDESAALEMEGIKVTAVSAGKYKTEYAPFAPLSEDARENLQRSVDATMEKFTGSLKRNRDVSIEKVRSDFGQGRLMNADDALRAGIVDRILPFEALLQKLTGTHETSAGGKAASSDVIRAYVSASRAKRRCAGVV